MNKIKILVCLLSIWMLFPINQSFAQEKLSLNDWKVNNFGKGKPSEVNSSVILLRQYSIVYKEIQSTQISSVAIACKWLNPLDYVEMPIKLTLYYHDGSSENIQQKIPKGMAMEQKLEFIPKNISGSKVVKIEIQHGSTGMEVEIFSVEIFTTSNCSEKIQTLNSEFGNLIDEMKKNGNVDIETIRKLENLLSNYKGIK